MTDFIDILKKLIQDYGDEVLGNAGRTHAILLDLAHDEKRNRLLARHFVEAGGYSMLRNAELTSTKSDPNYSHVQAAIIRKLREDFSIEANAASWICHLFAVAMGLADESDMPTVVADYVGVKSIESVPEADPTQAVAIGMSHCLALMADGTVFANGIKPTYARNDYLQCDVGDWLDVRAIAAGDAHSLALFSDGTVVAIGRNTYDQCDVGNLSDMAAIFAFGDDTICVGQDGSAVSVGKSKFDLRHFEEIKSIAWHPEGVYGIRKDGKIMMSSTGWEEEEWVLSLEKAVQIISTYVNGSLVLTEGGRVYKMGEPDSYFAHLRDIVAIADLSDGFAVLRKDGLVRVLPYDRNTPRKPSEADNWQGIVAIYGKYKRLIALTNEGRLLATCTDPDWMRRNGDINFVEDWYPVWTQG